MTSRHSRHSFAGSSRLSARNAAKNSSTSRVSRCACFIGLPIVVIITLVAYSYIIHGHESLYSSIMSDLTRFKSAKQSLKWTSSTIALSNEQTSAPNNTIQPTAMSDSTDTEHIEFGRVQSPMPNVHHLHFKVQDTLAQHPFNRLSAAQRSSFALEDHLEYLQKQPECAGKPLFTSMANVFSALYWQLIENFVYTMVKFELSHCTVMVCVTDDRCMQLCDEAGFPCYDFRYDSFHPVSSNVHCAVQSVKLLLLALYLTIGQAAAVRAGANRRTQAVPPAKGSC